MQIREESIQMIQSRGDKCDELFVELLPYFGIDYSKKGFVFSGQGSIRPGILKDKISDYPYIQNRLKEVDEICLNELGFNVSEYIYKHETLSAEKIKLAESICLLAMQLGIFDTYKIAKGNPEVICGHSFGDFTALVAAGIIDIRDMLSFLNMRNSCVEKFGKLGELIAVSSDLNEVINLPGFNKNFWISNINSQKQIVLAVGEEAAKDFKKNLKEKKIPHVKLALKYPYHSPLLDKACLQLKQEWQPENCKLTSSKIRLILSSGLFISSNFDFSIKENKAVFWEKLIKQLITPVDLTAIISDAENNGVFHFVEIAPMKILTEEIKNSMDNRKSYFSLDQLSEMQKNKKSHGTRAFGDKILSTLNKALGKLTGYKIAEIEMSNRMREDLGIDSIKKAEIIFEVLDNLNLSKVTSNSAVNLSELATVEDVMSYLESLLKAKDMQIDQEIDQSVFSKMKFEWEKSDEIFWAHNTDIKLDIKIELESKLDEIKFSEKIVVLELEDSYSEITIYNYKKFFYKRLIPLFRKINNSAISLKEVYIISGESFWCQILACLIRNICIEKEIQFKHIEFNKKNYNTLDVCKILNQESVEPFYNHVRYIDGIRFVPKLKIDKKPKRVDKKIKKALILGGSGGIGQVVVKKLLSLNCEQIIIVGRRKDLSEELSKLWESHLLSKQVQYLSLDLSDEVVTKSILTELFLGASPVDLVINMAGAAINKKVDLLSGEDLYNEMSSKVIPAIVINEILFDRQVKVDIIHFSSIAGDFGNPGQAAYSLANYFLGALSDVDSRVTTISWPAWENLGMAKDALSNKAIKLSGLSEMTTKQGEDILEDIFQEERGGSSLILDPKLKSKYTSIGQTQKHYNKLFNKIPSRESLVSLTGVTLENLPFYRDHLVKGRCVLPGSGSFALMLYAFYSDFGVMPIVKEFTAFTVAIVQENYSNFVLTKKSNAREWEYSIRSNYIHAEIKCTLPEGNEFYESSKLNFEADAELDIDSLKMDAIYLGPKFVQAHRGWLSKNNELLLMINLRLSPVFSGVPFWDKIHKLIEMSAHSFGEAVWCKTEFQVIPKEYKNIKFSSRNMCDEIFYFYPMVNKISETEAEGSLNIYNSIGDVAVQIEGVRMSVIHGSVGIKKFQKINTKQYSFDEISNLVSPRV